MPLSDDELTYQVIGCFRWVYNEIGCGMLESAYAGALSYACRKRGLVVDREINVPFYFDGEVVANYRVDLLVDRRLIIELKACDAPRPEHVKQVLHYLRATDFELGLLFNFGPEPLVKRFTLRNALKKRSSEQQERDRIETTRKGRKEQEHS